MAKPTQKEIRKARNWLFSRQIKDIPPKKFASAAKEMDVGFRRLLQFIGRLQMGGQGQQMRRQEIIERETR